MVHRKLIYENNISFREENMIKYVMSKYGVEANEIYRARSAYKIVTLKGNLCLKRLTHGYGKASNGNYLVEHLFQMGFDNTAKFIKNNEGELYVKYRKFTFYVTEWIDGEECNLDDICEATNCIKLLAKFHITANNIDTSKLKIKNNLKNWPKIFTSTLNELETYKIIAEKKRIKNEFDLLYLNYVDIFYDRVIKAIEILNCSYYYNISANASKNKSICHDSFYYQNILKKGDKYYLIDLDSIIIDLEVVDIAKFIRRIMYNKNYNWSFDKALVLIEAYSSIKPLSYKELEIMLALISFPHKFWKLGKKRFIKQKNWSEQKYMHKLRKLINNCDLENTFFEKFSRYISELKLKQID
jgi:CotS family spore coat protein